MLPASARPILARCWTILAYSVPTSVLLLFGLAHACGADGAIAAKGSAADTAVVLGNREIVAATTLVAVLVLLSMDSAVRHWLDARWTELLVAHIAGAARLRIIADQLAVVLAVHVAGYAVAIALYGALRALTSPEVLPPFDVQALSSAFVASTVLVAAAATASIGVAFRNPDVLRARR
ncbi:MAG: hypothetical protein N3B11_07770 [Coriobacteriia bacterium]|nr:hypothetical protein [Coriobacteriia bacterium]